MRRRLALTNAVTAMLAVLLCAVPLVLHDRDVLGFFVVAAVALPSAAAVVADRLGRSIVRTTAQLTDVADRLRRGDLTARYEGGGPAELEQLGRTLNTLAARIDALLVNEREALADLSHRLRTPITLLMLQAEALSVEEDANRMLAGITDLNDELTWIIRRARHPICDRKATTDLAAVAHERIEFWAPLAEEQGRGCELDVPAGPCTVLVPKTELVAAIDALIENTFAHTPEGTSIKAAVVPADGAGAVFVLEDDGPGFTDLRVLDRGHSTGGSTGLGLDICRRTTIKSGGRVELGRAHPRGARVSLFFGGPPSGSVPFLA
ncbi:sensor histidine kinase [Streptomyces sp. NPDC090021]|uniref:sensor histidine kinase n=1 Tax=Streptomyces sp. NPDC090021 TaxID=3365919 RepID=UPI0037F5E3DA